jgi:hypothetical protein
MDVLERSQVTANPAEDVSGAAADVAGGYALTSEGADQPIPTAQGLRPAAWLAGAWCDSRLVPSDRQQDAWQHQRQALRFTMQLAMGEMQAAMHRDPARAIGGICTSVWDSRQPLAAQALGLLFVVDSLRVWPEAGSP